VQALKDDHAVTLLTWRRPDLPALNRFFGTTIGPRDLALALPPLPLRALIDALPAPTYLLRTAILLRLARRRARDFDVLLTGDNEADFGPRGVQYINYPWDLLPRPALETRWYHGRAPVTLYRELCIRLAAFSDERMRRTPALVSSDYVGRLVDQRYGLVPRTLYPPVIGTFPAVPWAEREAAFLCVGRIAPRDRRPRPRPHGASRRAPAHRRHARGRLRRAHRRPRAGRERLDHAAGRPVPRGAGGPDGAAPVWHPR
jgi:hypothetical protein